MIIVGIDPGLAKFGVVAIDTATTGKPTVVFKRTVRKGEKDTDQLLAPRLLSRYNELQDVLDDAAERVSIVGRIDAIAMEDPCDAYRVKSKPSTVASIGAAFGMEYGAVIEWINEQAAKGGGEYPAHAIYNTSTWLPKAGRGGWQYNAKHKDAKVMIMRQLILARDIKRLTDDETMAAGVALFHAHRARLLR